MTARVWALRLVGAVSVLVLSDQAVAVPLRDLKVEADGLSWTTQRGLVRRLTSADVPSRARTSDALTEAWINDEWVPRQGCACQVRVHVVGRSPLRVVVRVWVIGETIAPTWYLDE